MNIKLYLLLYSLLNHFPEHGSSIIANSCSYVGTLHGKQQLDRSKIVRAEPPRAVVQGGTAKLCSKRYAHVISNRCSMRSSLNEKQWSRYNFVPVQYKYCKHNTESKNGWMLQLHTCTYEQVEGALTRTHTHTHRLQLTALIHIMYYTFLNIYFHLNEFLLVYTLKSVKQMSYIIVTSEF